MGQKIASLEIELGMATGTAVADLNRFGGAVDKVSAQAIRDLDRIDASMKNVGGLDAATASAVRLADETARTALQMARDAERSERAGERVAAGLERQIAAYGLTRSELRALRSEEAAADADRVGHHERAARIRQLEATMYDAEFAASRKARQEADAAAEDAAAAADRAARAKEQEAQAVREASLAYQMFEARVRAGVVAMREEEAASRAAAAAIEQQERRTAALGVAMFEAYGKQKMGEYNGAQAAQAVADAEREADARRQAAYAYAMFEDAARKGGIALREQEAAAAQDVATLARLREMIDPAAASQNRLNGELAEARRVMTAAGASAQELAAAEDALWAKSQRSVQQHDLLTGAATRSSGALRNVALQLPDITQGLLTGQPPMTVFIQQGFQIVQVAQMAEGGLRGFGKELGLLALRFSPFLVALAAAGAGVALFTRWVNQGVSNEQLTQGLGKITGGADATKQELYKLKDTTVSFGSVAEAVFKVVGQDIASAFVGDMAAMGTSVKSILDDMTSYARKALAGLYAGVAGTKAYLGEVEKGGVLGIGKMLIGQGDPNLLKKTYGAAYDVADKYLGDLGNRVRKEAVNIERQKLADKIGFNNAPKPKVDHHAEQLAREAAAIEAQIKNLYALADAYGVSGAAALIAEARVKAESKAIKQRGDIEAAVAREVRLSIAERVKAAAQGTAALRDQAAVQRDANEAILAGQVPAEQAAGFMRDRMADLPLLAAMEAAKAVGDVAGAQAATDALAKQRAAQDALTDAEREGRRVSAMAAGLDQLATLREELRLVGATDMARTKALATMRAEQAAIANGWSGDKALDYVNQQVAIAEQTEALRQKQDDWNASLSATSDLFDTIDQAAQSAASGMADAFGSVGSAIGDVFTVMTGYYAEQARLQQAHEAAIRDAHGDQTRINREQQLFAIRSSSAQIGAYGDMASAAKGFFDENSTGYRAIAAAEKAFRLAQFAMSVAAMVQNAAETLGFVTNSAARATAAGTAGIAEQSKLPFPANLIAMAATGAALVAAGVAIVGSIGGGGGSKAEATNTGTGTVLGDPTAQSESLRRGIDALKEVETLMLTSSRQMASYLRSIDSQIGGFAAQIVRSGDVNASAGVTGGFKKDMIGSVVGAIPLIGGFLGGLFGSKTTVVGSGLYGGAQSVGDILASGYDASTYSDVTKTKKFLGVTTSKKTSTQYAAADGDLENQFTLILRGFASAIGAAAGPLGEATDAVQARLNGFVVDIGKVDLKGLTGEQIQEKLEVIFGAAADGMAEAAFPGIGRFQKAGEGMFETLVRVSSTVEAVTASFEMLGRTGIGVDASVELAGLFDSVSDLTSAQQGYFEAFYDEAEQAAARRAQLERALGSLGVAMPATLASFRALVEAQDLATEAGRSTYATLIQLAPAFADLQTAMGSAKSAADIMAERQDLERKLLELNGDQAAIRALDLAKLDASNRGLQQQVWAAQAAQEAAKAAEEARKAWAGVGDSLMDEVRRIRGLSAEQSPAGFAGLMGQFNAATASARGGDMDAAKLLPGLSKSLLDAAADVTTSRQELDRVQAEAAASLEATYAAIAGYGGADNAQDTAARSAEAMSQAATAATSTASSTADLLAEFRSLRSENAEMKQDLISALVTIAGNTGRAARRLDDVTAEGGGQAITVRSAA